MPALIERPEMSRAMWDALKTHILKERKRKKQEQEADAEEERLRRERENQQKQNIMTLDETKEQLAQLEVKLKELKDEKHELFNQLKKVLHEDETKRRAMTKEANELVGLSSSYQTSHMNMAHPQVFMNGNIQARHPVMYKIGLASHSSAIPQASLKRQRSPSPPPGAYHPNYKAPPVGPYGPPKHGPFSSAGPVVGQPGSSYYGQSSGIGSLRAPPSHLSCVSSATSSVLAAANTIMTQSQPHVGPYSSFRSQFSQGHPADAKHLHPGYHLQSLPAQSAYAAGLLQQQLEQANQKPTAPGGPFPDERMYLCQSANMTSGYPVHVVQSAYQSKPSSNPPVAHGSSSSQRISANHPPTSRFY